MNLGELPFVLLALVVAAVASYVLTPLAMRFAAAIGAMDEPDAGRRIHSRPVARTGGLAVVVSFLSVGVITLLVNASAASSTAGPFPRQLMWGGDLILRDELVALLGGTALAAAFGFIDDRWQIRARWQLLFQVALAAFAVSLGVAITFLNNPFDFLGDTFTILKPDTIWLATLDDTSLERPLTAAAILVTVLWVVGMINSINFIDGLDGLSTGVALIAALTLGIISLTGEVGVYSPLVALLCAALAGALAGFLPWNFHPARVFIGTTGVMAVGYALAILAILGTAKVTVALLVLGVPIIDTFWIITRRVASRRSPFTPDRGHIHHRLLDLGLTHKGAVLLIYGICVVLALLGIVLAGGSGPLYAFMAFVIGSGLLLLLLTLRGGVDEALEASSYAADEVLDVVAPAAASEHVDEAADRRPPGGASPAREGPRR